VRRAIRRGAAVAGALAAGLGLAACGSSMSMSAESTTPEIGANSPLTTSLATATDSWAVIPMAANPAFWQVFVRPTTSATWRLVTPPGVADNGGLVAAVSSAASAGSGLTVAVRPSQDLLFSPLASTTDAGAKWSPGGPINATVAESPDALAASGGDLVTLLTDGGIETSADAGSTWQVIAKPGAIASSKAGKSCGSVTVTSVSFGENATDVLAGGTCGTSGTTAIFSYSGGSWTRVSLPVTGQLVRLTDGVALIRAKAGLTALFGGTGWVAYAPLATPQPSPTGWTASSPLPVASAIKASGTLSGGGAWVVLSNGSGATIAGPGQQWLPLPPLPAKTTVLAAGPGGTTDALAVSGATLTVWQLAPQATVWTKVQAINVPIQYGSSS
jgi:hypothetical protein